MKKPPVNLQDLLLSRYLGKMALVHKFVKFWGTTTIAGVEVLKEKSYYYKPMEPGTVKVAKLLGFYDSLDTSKMDGIDNAWLFLNAGKSSIGNVTDSLLAYNFNNIPIELFPA
jgi:hypothetical protein